MRIRHALGLLLAWSGCEPGEPPPAGPPAESRSAALRTETRSVPEVDGPGHLLVDLAWEDAGFRVVRTIRVASPLPKRRGGLRGLAWRYRVIGVDGGVLYEGELADPSVIRGEFHGTSESRPIESVRVRQPLPVHFAIRVPLVDADRIDFFGPDPLGAVAFPRVVR